MMDFWVHSIAFADHLGITLHVMHEGESELHYTAKPEHLNSFAMTHGGACMALLDITMTMAARSLLEEDTGCVTVEMKTSFMQPARGALVARGSVLHQTKSMLYCEAKLYDSANRLCAHATGTFKSMKRMKAAVN